MTVTGAAGDEIESSMLGEDEPAAARFVPPTIMVANLLSRDDRGDRSGDPVGCGARGGEGGTPKRFRCSTGRTDPLVGVFIDWAGKNGAGDGASRPT